MVQDIANKINKYKPKEGVLVKYTFKASTLNTVYQRAIFNIFDALSRLGGVYSALYSGGLAFTAAFSYKLYMSSLIGKLYHFRARFPEELKFKKDKKGKKKQKIKYQRKSVSGFSSEKEAMRT